MTILRQHTFDGGTPGQPVNADFDIYSPTPPTYTASGYSGNGMQCGPGTMYVQDNMAAEYQAMMINAPSPLAGETGFERVTNSGGSTICAASIDVDGTIRIYQGLSTVVGTSTVKVTIGQWFKYAYNYSIAGTQTLRIYLDPTSDTPDEVLTGACNAYAPAKLLHGIGWAGKSAGTIILDTITLADDWPSIGIVDVPPLVSHRAAFEALCPTTVSVYVSPTGSDTNDGSAAAPYATLQHALDSASAGDQILLAAGTYTASSNMYGKSGTANAWITISPQNDGDVVILNGAGSGDGAGVLYFQQCSYFGVYGLEIKATKTETPATLSGIAIFRGCHHGVIWQNRVHDVPSGGINCFWVDVNTDFGLPAGSHDVLDIQWNTIHGCANNDPNNSSGISIAEPMDISGTWPDGFAYHISNNYCFDNRCLQPYTAGGFAYVTDGNGISIDAFAPSNHPTDVPDYTKPVLVNSNIVTGNGGRGVHVHNAKNTTIINCVGIGNLQTDSPAINDQSEFDADTDTSVVVEYCVIYPRNSINWYAGNASYKGNIVLGGTQSVNSTNINKQTTGYAYFVGPVDDGSLTTEQDRAVFKSAAPTTKVKINGEWREVIRRIKIGGIFMPVTVKRPSGSLPAGSTFPITFPGVLS